MKYFLHIDIHAYKPDDNFIVWIEFNAIPDENIKIAVQTLAHLYCCVSPYETSRFFRFFFSSKEVAFNFAYAVKSELKNFTVRIT